MLCVEPVSPAMLRSTGEPNIALSSPGDEVWGIHLFPSCVVADAQAAHSSWQQERRLINELISGLFLVREDFPFS